MAGNCSSKQTIKASEKRLIFIVHSYPYVQIHLGYFTLSIIIFFTEFFIALKVDDEFIRPFIGDVLVVILIYCFMQAFYKFRVLPLAIVVLAFSFVIEFLQYLKFVNLIGLKLSKVARVVLGTAFSWKDILMYIIGFIIITIVEYYRKAINNKATRAS